MGKNDNIELKRILDILKSKVFLIVFILICFTLLGYLYSYYYVVPEYKSTATLLLIPNETSEQKAITTADLSLNSELISTYSNIAKQPKVLKQVINNLGLDMTEQELLKHMQVKILNSTYIIEISVTNTNAQMAMNITKELSNVFLKEIKEIYNLNNIGVIDEAQYENVAYNVNHIKDIAIFFAGGILVSGIAIVGFYIFDNTIKVEEDIERYVQIKTLGKIPFNNNQKNEIINRNTVKSYITECINTIRTNILYMNAVKGSKAILITSCTPREGKSWVSTNVAVAFAETNKKVLLIDCDMRKGRQHKIFGIDNQEGLSNYLYAMTGEIEKDAELGKQYIHETQIPNLHILTNGTIPPNPSELIDSKSMKELIKLCKTIYDVVIIDAPPCKLVTDSAILSRIVDTTILITRAGKTKINDLKDVKKSIEIVGGKIIGSILNQVKMTGKAYGNTYYYGHHTDENKCEVKEKTIVSVEAVINMAMPKLQGKAQNTIVIESTENNEVEKQTEKVENAVEVSNTDIRLYSKQNEHLEAVIDTLSDIKIQLKNNMLENELNDKEKAEKLEKLISQKIEELGQNNSMLIKEELQNINIAQEFSRILNELETVKANFQITKDDLEYTIKQGMLSKEEIEDIVKAEVVNKEEIKDIVKAEVVNKEEIKDIVKNEVLTKQTIEDIVKQDRLTKEDVAEIIQNEMLKKEDVQGIVNEGKLTKQEVQDIITSQMLTRQTVEAIVQEGRLTKEDVAEIIQNEVLKKEDVQNIVEEGKITIEQLEQIMHQELEKVSHIEQVNEMTNELETIRTNLNNMYVYMESMKQGLLTKEQLEDVMNTIEVNVKPQETITKETIESIVNENKLTKEDVQDIITSEMLTKQTVEEIVNESKLTKEDVQDIITSEMLTRKTVEDIVKEGRLTKEEIEEIIQNEMLDKQEIENIMKESVVAKEELEEMMKQELSKINYAEQIKEINEKMMNLQENYLEILNMIKAKQGEVVSADGENVIDMKSFKKQKEKKKRTYTIPEEMIPYQELEKTAIYTIPLNSNSDDNSASGEYHDDIVASR